MLSYSSHTCWTLSFYQIVYDSWVLVDTRRAASGIEQSVSPWFRQYHEILLEYLQEYQQKCLTIMNIKALRL